MSTAVAPVSSQYSPSDASRPGYLALALTAVAFVLLFAESMGSLARTWWNSPEAGHGLLLAPLAVWLAWRAGVRKDAEPNIALGIVFLVLAIALRYVGALAAEVFAMRVSMFVAVGGLIVFAWGFRQLLAWWLPVILLGLSIPLPEIVLSGLALPLQFKASQLGAALLESRGIPVRLDGNVIRLPGHDLFVTEACSGLRSLTALLSLGVLLGGVMLRHPASRVALVLVAIPVAVLVNGVRVFVTGFLALFVDAKLAEGASHIMEGWLLFLVSFTILLGVTWLVGKVEKRYVKEVAHA